MKWFPRGAGSQPAAAHNVQQRYGVSNEVKVEADAYNFVYIRTQLRGAETRINPSRS